LPELTFGSPATMDALERL